MNVIPNNGIKRYVDFKVVMIACFRWPAFSHILIKKKYIQLVSVAPVRMAKMMLSDKDVDFLFRANKISNNTK